jgi:hypothetical protein
MIFVFIGSTNSPSSQTMCSINTFEFTQNAHFLGLKLMLFFLHKMIQMFCFLSVDTEII